ncbi:MAG: hypothetical protein H7832_13185 [Magnetococcus sp. DMHC-6]
MLTAILSSSGELTPPKETQTALNPKDGCQLFFSLREDQVVEMRVEKKMAYLCMGSLNHRDGESLWKR